MQIPLIVILGPIIVVWILLYIFYKLIKEHIDERFEELKKYMKENQ